MLISGLGLEGAGPGNEVNELLLDLVKGNVDVLLDVLKNQDIRFSGSTGADAFKGFGAGDDRLTGAAGADTFRFAGEFGQDRIVDFDAGTGVGDQISLRSSQFADFDAVLEAARDVGGNLLIRLDDDHTITLLGVQEADLDPNDFLFV